MGRPEGSRNADFAEKRAELGRAVCARLLEPDGARASFRELAAAAGVATATLKHYFGTRDDVVRAALEGLYTDGIPYLLKVTQPPEAPLRASLEPLVRMVVVGMRRGLGHVHAFGLGAGLRDPAIGPAYLDCVLEPTLQAFEARLAHHAARNELRSAVDLRVASLALLSPVLLGILHQDALGGAVCRRLDVDAFVTAHFEAWLRAYASAADAR